MDSVAQLQRLLTGKKRAVFFGGAGCSTESGIPDFRSTDGLYHQQWAYPPETILSQDFFWQKTEEFYRFYREKMLFPAAQPNAAHRALAQLEEQGILSAVITQNIDGLHQAAGSQKVIELHGSVLRNFCTRCHRFYNMEAVLHSQGVPRCDCGGVIKPDVVLYGEPLDPSVTEAAMRAIDAADLLIVGGTSLSVYPAAWYAAEYKGPLVIINRTTTSMDQRADLIIRAPIGETLGELMARMRRE